MKIQAFLGLFLYCVLMFLLNMVMECLCIKHNNKKLTALYAIKGYRLYGLYGEFLSMGSLPKKVLQFRTTNISFKFLHFRFVNQMNLMSC